MENKYETEHENKYIQTLLAQIREKRAKEYVRREITDHLEEQKASYIAEGIPQEQAAQKAVADMGDPVETGTALDRIHKPKPALGLLAVIAVLCLTGVILQYTILLFGAAPQQGDYFFKKQCLYAVAGFFVLCAVYLTDYTTIARYSRQLCTAVLLLLFLTAVHGKHGLQTAPYWLSGFYFSDILLSPSILLYLYIPLYCAVLYSFRNCRKKDWVKILLYTILPVCFSCQISFLSVTLNLSVILSVLLAAAIKKGWFFTDSVRLSVFLVPAGLLTVFLAVFPLASYQSARIKAWFFPDFDTDGAGYVHHMTRQILNSSQLIGKSGTVSADGYLPNYPTDYILTYIIGNFGMLAAALLVILVALLAGKLLHISIHQKNQLGMIMGLGCSLTFALQAAEYILVNLSLLPAASLSFPLISFGGSSMIQTCVLLGILLSIYRYENVLPEPELHRPHITKLL